MLKNNVSAWMDIFMIQLSFAKNVIINAAWDALIVLLIVVKCNKLLVSSL